MQKPNSFYKVSPRDVGTWGFMETNIIGIVDHVAHVLTTRMSQVGADKEAPSLFILRHLFNVVQCPGYGIWPLAAMVTGNVCVGVKQPLFPL